MPGDVAADAILEGEALVALQEAGAPLTAAVVKLEAAGNALRAAKCSTEKQRQLGNLVEWARMVKMRVDRLAQQIAEGS